jgi:oxalate decarboxylase
MPASPSRILSPGAASLGSAGEPPQGIENAQGNPRSAVDRGSQNPTLTSQSPTAFIPPATNVGDLPLFCASFNESPRRIQDAGGRIRSLRQISRCPIPSPA